MNETILTENQLTEIVEKLEETRNEVDLVMPEDAETSYIPDDIDLSLQEGEGVYLGDGIIMEDEIELSQGELDKLNESIENIVTDNIKENISKNYDLSDEDALKFAEVISRVRNNEKFNVYDELPTQLKTFIDMTVKDQNIPSKDRRAVLNYTAKLLIDELISDSEFDALSVDLEKAMKELIPAPLEMYSETNRDYIENEFLRIAEKIKDDEPKKAQNLLDMRKGYIDAYTFEPMYELFKDSKVVKNIRRVDVMWRRVEIEYTKIAGVCKFRLYALDDILKALEYLGLDKTQAKRLTSLFVYAYIDGIKDTKDPEEYDDIYRNSFANYFQSNIKNLAINPNLISDFSKNIKENIMALVNHIDTIIAEREVELSNNKKKRG